jgi:hypothetical protein
MIMSAQDARGPEENERPYGPEITTT